MRLKFRTLVAANTAIFMSETMIGRLGCMKKKQGPAGTEAPAGPIEAAKGSGLLLLLELLRDDALRQRPRGYREQREKDDESPARDIGPLCERSRHCLPPNVCEKLYLSENCSR